MELYPPEGELGLITRSLVFSHCPGHSLLLILDKGTLGEELERNAKVGVCFCSPLLYSKQPLEADILIPLRDKELEAKRS